MGPYSNCLSRPNSWVPSTAPKFDSSTSSLPDLINAALMGEEHRHKQAGFASRSDLFSKCVNSLRALLEHDRLGHDPARQRRLARKAVAQIAPLRWNIADLIVVTLSGMENGTMQDAPHLSPARFDECVARAHVILEHDRRGRDPAWQ